MDCAVVSSGDDLIQRGNARWYDPPYSCAFPFPYVRTSGTPAWTWHAYRARRSPPLHVATIMPPECYNLGRPRQSHSGGGTVFSFVNGEAHLPAPEGMRAGSE